MTDRPKEDRTLVTLTEAHQALKVPLGTLYSWVSRKVLTGARVGASGKHLYYLDEIQELASTTRRRKSRDA
jgi:hypothetical protein